MYLQLFKKKIIMQKNFNELCQKLNGIFLQKPLEAGSSSINRSILIFSLSLMATLKHS
jgi:hypothetical protein